MTGGYRNANDRGGHGIGDLDSGAYEAGEYGEQPGPSYAPPPRQARRGPLRNRAGARRRTIVTPARLMLLVALVGSVVFLAWGILTRGPTQVPVLITGLGILGLTLATVAVGGAVVAWRSGTRGKGGRAFLAAFLGGIIAIAAFVCFTAAAILTLLWRAT